MQNLKPNEIIPRIRELIDDSLLTEAAFASKVGLGPSNLHKKALTSHVGRRTAGYIWLNGGIPMEVVAKCLGHTSIKTTEKAYARILDKTVIAAFTDFINK